MLSHYLIETIMKLMICKQIINVCHSHSLLFNIINAVAHLICIKKAWVFLFHGLDGL